MNEATKLYILAHADSDVRQLALQGCKDPQIDLPMALQQIQGRQTARRKLPSWAAVDGIVYPPHLSMEQCSSEATARYKTKVIDDLRIFDLRLDSQIENRKSVNRKFLDLTGGFGVDFAFLSMLFNEAVYVEQQEVLCAAARHNFDLLPGLGARVQVVCAQAEEFLHRLEEHVALIFLDPARRDQRGGRTYGIGDCTPDVLPLLDELLRKADYVLLKLSPMLDWRKAVNDVGARHVEQVHIVATGGECKELLLLLSAQGSQQPVLVCANDGQEERFQVTDAIETIDTIETIDAIETMPAVPLPGGYLYEPNAALMKGGFFLELARRYGVRPLAANSHLFCSQQPVEGFPGRAFRITTVSTMNKQELKTKILPLRQANISVRNFPLTVAQLRQRLKLGEGGSNYLFATTLASGQRVLLVCEKTPGC